MTIINKNKESKNMKKLFMFLICIACTTSIYCMDIFEAARTGNNERIKELITAGTNVNQKTDYDFTPLHYATANGHLDVVQSLVHAGANINAKEIISADTPLHMAITNRHLEIAKFLLASGADYVIKNDFGLAPLLYAEGFHCGAIIDLLWRVSCAHTFSNKQIMALLCAGHARLGAASPIQDAFHTHSQAGRIIASYMHRTAVHDAIYGHK